MELNDQSTVLAIIYNSQNYNFVITYINVISLN